MRHPIAALAAVALAAFAATACVTPTASPPAPAARLGAASGAPLGVCEGLAAAFTHPATRIESAAPVAAGAAKLGDRPLPAHCLVKGRMNERKGADGRDYAIGFEVRLPRDWNGRFYYQGNGGLDGTVQPAFGALGGGPVTGALMQGFAVLSSDAGHTGAQTPYFGLEPQARLDYGWQAVGTLTPMAKALIAGAYGKGPDRSYIGGCSNGGRHAMVAASRWSAHYDGYLAGAPGYRLPRAAAAQLWGAQQWAPLAAPGATVPHPLSAQAPRIPDLGSGFTPAERKVVADAVLARCDALDGAKDGLIQSVAACQAAFDPKRDIPVCNGGTRGGACLAPPQIDVLARVQAGAALPSGEPIYVPFPWDAGIAGANWAQWKFVNAVALDPLSTATVFSAPPMPVDPFKVDLTQLMARMQATDATYRESGLSLMSPPGEAAPSNLEALRARGAKMILFHGVSDAIFSIEDTRRWLDRVDRAQGGRGEDFARMFPVPGMNHCAGGPATDQFDLLTPLVKWVEDGVAPTAVVASARGAGNGGGVNAELPSDWSPGRTRPLCAWPRVATYVGGGSVEDAANFACR